jgi:hypothetical protein
MPRPTRKKVTSRVGYSNNRIAWARVGQVEVTIYLIPSGEDNHADVNDEGLPEIVGPNVHVAISAFRGSIMLKLTALTEEELLTMRRLLEAAFDMAEPLTKHRDEVAEHAFREGNDSYIRIYRRVPELVVRPRAGGEYGKELRQRLAVVPELVRGIIERRTAGRPSDLMAGVEPLDVGTEDGRPTPDHPA